MAIAGFRHKGLERLYREADARGVPPQYARKLRLMLSALQSAATAEELATLPGWRLHRLKGDFVGFWSLTVTGNLRIVFRFSEGMAADVDLVDYH